MVNGERNPEHGGNVAPALVRVELPVAWTFAGLIAGLLVGLVLGGTDLIDPVLSVAEPVGGLWLRALQMTIIPLVAALLVIGISSMARAASAGRTARILLAVIFAVLMLGGMAAVLLTPLLLDVFPIPPGAIAFAGAAAIERQELPGIADFFTSLIAPNLVAAAAETAMLPLTIFFALFAIAITRLPTSQSTVLLGFFHALGNAMLVIIGWVLWLAPIGVFALGLGVGVRAGGGAFAALLHYIAIVSSVGLVVLFAAYLLGSVVGGAGFTRFAKALLPAQAVAVSTQSSLASLPAMLDSANRLDLRERTAEFVLPLAVAIFRATSPAMNLAVVIYVAYLMNVPLGPARYAAAIGVAFIISIGSVSLPGTISFVVSVGPIALAMGVPIEPFAILVAVEMLPDIMRTLANVTMNVAVASVVERRAS